jgi:alkylhydroperoxidase family enzyme
MDVSPTRYEALISELQAAAPNREAPHDFDGYLEKVRRHAYSITDRDVQALKDAGYSEDEIFEHTVSTAVAAGIERLNAGLETLR